MSTRSSIPMKSVYKSNTTRAVATSAAGTTAGVLGLLAWLRATFGEALPWPAQMDWVIATGANTIVVPMISRILKAWKARKDAEDRMGGITGLPGKYGVLLLCVALSLAGCQHLLPQRSVTVTYPDGRTEVTSGADIETALALAEFQLDAAKQAVEVYKALVEMSDQSDALKYQRELAARQAKLEEVQQVVTAFRDALGLRDQKVPVDTVNITQ